jgi:hypothetical protein
MIPKHKVITGRHVKCSLARSRPPASASVASDNKGTGWNVLRCVGHHWVDLRLMRNETGHPEKGRRTVTQALGAPRYLGNRSQCNGRPAVAFVMASSEQVDGVGRGSDRARLLRTAPQLLP